MAALFLKINKTKYGNFLQISQTTYDTVTKKSSNKCFKKIGYEKTLIEKGIVDPISYYKKYAKELNDKQKKFEIKLKREKISDIPIVKNFGYFLAKQTLNTIQFEKEIKLLDPTSKLRCKLNDLIQALVFSRLVEPCSKSKTFRSVMPTLFENYNISLDQIYDGLNFLGTQYPLIITLFNEAIRKTFSRETNKVYFDCTNYYFEIDYEYDDKQKGPSKENRPNPIIGQALLLDSQGVPLSMRMYPGNESEKPKIRELINEMKKENHCQGRTIQVADKGLNCGDNIYETELNCDGYIFSQSVSQLPEKEQNWILNSNDYKEFKNSKNEVQYAYKSWTDDFQIRITDANGKKIITKVKQKRVATFNQNLRQKKLVEINKLIEKANNLCYSQAKKSEFGECGKYVNFLDENGDKSSVKLNYEKIEKDQKLAGYNLIVTSEVDMNSTEIYETYHNLWKIEETFRILKSQLQARPIFLQDHNEIYGHFLTLYIAVSIIRLLEIKIFKKAFNYSEILNIIRSLMVIKRDNDYLNISMENPAIKKLCIEYQYEVDYRFMSSKEITQLFKGSFNLKRKLLH